MTTIRSTWTRPAPTLTGLLPSTAWSGSATMPIPHGTLMAQNDATTLSIGIDITDETGAANPDDYFWFIVDINDNGVIDSKRDILFGEWPGNPNRLGLWYMAAPNETWPAPNTQVIASKVMQGFGASTNSATAHRQWQITFTLNELGITLDPTAPAPVVRFGLRIATLSAAFLGETPPNPLASFTNFNEIILSTAPTLPATGPSGPVIASIGLIGTGLIGADGYCNVPATYIIKPVEAAFSGTLNFISNVGAVTSLWAAGATKYKVFRRFGLTPAAAAAAPWLPILQAWTNFEVVGTTDVWQSFGPDSAGFYPLVNPGLSYTTQDLIFQWSTGAESDGVHQFEFAFFNASGTSIASTPQIVTLKLDNQAPIVDLTNVLHAGAPVASCAIVNLTSITDGVQIQYEAFQPEGDLESFALTALYGHGQYSPIYSDAYAAHASPTHIWQGVSTDTQPVPPALWVPPGTCAYLFQIQAWSRTTDGYSYPVIQSTDFQTVTLIKPGIILKPLPILAPIHATPTGFGPPPVLGTTTLAPVSVLPPAVEPLKS